MANVGLSFGDPGARGGQLRSSPAATTQDAIRTLSIRMPTVLGGSAPAPPSLMGGPTMQGGNMGGSMAENFLRMLFGGQPMASNPMMMGGQGMGMAQSGGQGGQALPASVTVNNNEPRQQWDFPTPPPTAQPPMPQVPRFGDPFNGGREGRNRV